MINGLEGLCQIEAEPKRKLPEYDSGNTGKYDKRTPREVAYELAMAHNLSGGLRDASSSQVEEMLEILGFPASETVVLYPMEPEVSWHAQALNAVRHARANRIAMHELKEWMQNISREHFCEVRPYCRERLNEMRTAVVQADRAVTHAVTSVLDYRAEDKK